MLTCQVSCGGNVSAVVSQNGILQVIELFCSYFICRRLDSAAMELLVMAPLLMKASLNLFKLCSPMKSATFLSASITWLLSQVFSCCFFLHCLISGDGALWTWGKNDHGQLGIDSKVAVASPQMVRLGDGVVPLNGLFVT